MKFKDKNEAFNHYRTATAEDIEKRAAEIGKIIDTDANAEVNALNVELDGLKMAKENLEARSAAKKKMSGFNPITGKSFSEKSEKRDDDIFSSVEYRSAFYKKMLGKPLAQQDKDVFSRAQEQAITERRAAITTGTNTAVIPTTTLNEIVQKATTQGNILQYVRQFRIPANLSVPVATPEDAAEWHTEGTDVTPNTNTPTGVTFNAYELMKVFSMSVAANTMSIPAFESYLSTELTRTIGAALNSGVFNGTGSKQAQGILPGITWNAANSATFANSGLKYTDVLNLASLLKAGYSTGAVFAMSNKTLFSRVMAVTDTTGRPMFTTPTTGGAGYMLGYPVVIDDYIPDDTILFGNFQYYGLNLSQDILLEVSRESSFKQGLIDYRAMAVADGKVIVPEAFAKMAAAEA